MVTKTQIVLCFMLFIFPASLFAQVIESENESYFDKFKSEELNVGALLQAGGVFSLYNDGFNGGRKYDLKAARLYMHGEMDSKLSYRFKLDFGEQVSVLEAHVGYQLARQIRIAVGAFKPYLSRDLDADLGDLEFINRARHTSAMMNRREIGMTLIGDHRFINYRFGVYNGTGLSRINDDYFLYTSQLAFGVNIHETRLNLGVSGALNMSQNVFVGDTELISADAQYLYGGFLEVKSTYFLTKFEFLQTRFNALNLQGREEIINGFYATAGVNLGHKHQLLARIDHLGFNLLNQASERVLLGWNSDVTDQLSLRLNLLAQFNHERPEQYGVESVLQFQF